uniref:Uncharacterized protein n=1 Tax=Noctiluca scintillans TaxID=2966 RepID=A0A7S1FIX1_NOCSC
MAQAFLRHIKSTVVAMHVFACCMPSTQPTTDKETEVPLDRKDKGVNFEPDARSQSPTGRSNQRKATGYTKTQPESDEEEAGVKFNSSEAPSPDQGLPRASRSKARKGTGFVKKTFPPSDDEED